MNKIVMKEEDLNNKIKDSLIKTSHILTNEQFLNLKKVI